MNNFKTLEAQQTALFTKQKEKVVFDRVSGTMDVFRFLGAIVEMYVPVMANTIVGLTDAEGNTENVLSDNEEPTNTAGAGARKKPEGPKGTDEIIR